MKVWDWPAGNLLRTINMVDAACQLRQMCIGEVAGEWWIFATITHARWKRGKTKKQKRKMDKKKALGSELESYPSRGLLNICLVVEYMHRVVRAPLAEPPSGIRGSSSVIGRVSAPPVAIFLSPRSTYLVALAGSKAYTYRLPSPNSQSGNPDQWNMTLIKFVSDHPFTCGSFSPERTLGGRSYQEEWFASGDTRGIIRLWHGLGVAFAQVDAVASRISGALEPGKLGYPDTEKRLPTTSLHWHAHAVAAIAFTVWSSIAIRRRRKRAGTVAFGIRKERIHSEIRRRSDS